MPRTRSSRFVPTLVIPILVLLLVVACSSGSSEPVGLGDPLLAIAALGQGGSAVSVLTSNSSTSAMEPTRLFELPGGTTAYHAVIGPTGDFFVSNFNAGTISVITTEEALSGSDPDSAVVAATKTFSSPDLATPAGMAFDSRGDLWVLDQLNSSPGSVGPNRILRFAQPASIADGASVPAATILDLAEQPTGFRGHQLLYTLHVDAQDRLWYVDTQAGSINRLDDLANRVGHQSDVVPDMQLITWDPAVVDAEAYIPRPVDIVVSGDDLYVTAAELQYVFRIDGVANLSGPQVSTEPSALLTVGVLAPRFIDIDSENALWALSNINRQLVRVVGQDSGSGLTELTPTHTLTWASAGSVYGGGMHLSDPAPR